MHVVIRLHVHGAIHIEFTAGELDVGVVYILAVRRAVPGGGAQRGEPGVADAAVGGIAGFVARNDRGVISAAVDGHVDNGTGAAIGHGHVQAAADQLAAAGGHLGVGLAFLGSIEDEAVLGDQVPHALHIRIFDALTIRKLRAHNSDTGIRVVHGHHGGGRHIDGAEGNTLQLRLGVGHALGVHRQLTHVDDLGAVADDRHIAAGIVPGDGRVYADRDRARVGRHGAGFGGGRLIGGVGLEDGFIGLHSAVADEGGVIRPHIRVVHADAHRQRAHLSRREAGFDLAAQVAGHVELIRVHVAVIHCGYSFGVVEGQQHVAAHGCTARRYREGLGNGLGGDGVEHRDIPCGDLRHRHILSVGVAHAAGQAFADMGVDLRRHVSDSGVQVHARQAYAHAQQVAVGGGVGVGVDCQDAARFHVAARFHYSAGFDAGFLLETVEAQGYARVHSRQAAAHGGSQRIHAHIGMGFERDVLVIVGFYIRTALNDGFHLAVGLSHGHARARAVHARRQGTGGGHDGIIVVRRFHIDIARVCHLAAQHRLGGVVGQGDGCADSHASHTHADGYAEHADAAVLHLLEQFILERGLFFGFLLLALGFFLVVCLLVVLILGPVGHQVGHGLVALAGAGILVKCAADGIRHDVHAVDSVFDFTHAGGGHIAVQDGYGGADANAHRAAAQRRADQIDGHRLAGFHVHLLRVHDRLFRDAGDHRVGGIEILVSVDVLGVLHVLGVAVVGNNVAFFVPVVQIQGFSAALVGVVVKVLVVQILAAILGGAIEGGLAVLLAADLLLALIVAVALQIRFQGIGVQIAFLVAVAVILAGYAVFFRGLQELGSVQAGLVVGVLLFAVAVHDHVSGVLAHGRTGGQHHHGDARANHARGSHAGAQVNYVSLAGGRHAHLGGVDVGFRGVGVAVFHAAQLGDGAALHDADYGIHARGHGTGSRDGRTGRAQLVVALGIDRQVALRIEGHALHGAGLVCILAHQHVRRAGQAHAAADRHTGGIQVHILIGRGFDLDVVGLHGRAGFQLRFGLSLEVGHHAHGGRRRAAGRRQHRRADVVQGGIILTGQVEVAASGLHGAAHVGDGLALQDLHRRAELDAGARGQARADGQLLDVVLVLGAHVHALAGVHIMSQGFHVLVGNDGHHRRARAGAQAGAQAARQQHLGGVVVGFDGHAAVRPILFILNPGI